jgi:hypothetical protein
MDCAMFSTPEPEFESILSIAARHAGDPIRTAIANVLTRGV